jgi:hypothetical protein
MKRFLVIAPLLFLGMSLIHSQVYKTVNLVTAGTLSDSLTVTDKGIVSHLTVSGNVNAADFGAMRQMTGLRYLNLSAASIAGDSIPDEALVYMYNIDSVDLPASVVYIGKSAFRENGLKKITLPPNLKVIEESAFTWSHSIDSIYIPSSVEYIGNAAFSHCKELRTICLPASLKHIGEYVFIRCTALRNLTLDEANQNFTIENGALYNADKSTIIYFPGKYPVTEFTLPASVDSIADYAFHSNSILKVINLPGSLIYVGRGAFDESDSLQEINVNPANTVFSSEDGILYDREKTTVYKCPPDRTGQCILPSTVKYIDIEAFAGSKLSSVILPQGLKSIGQSSFDGCINLTSLEIPDSTYFVYAPFNGCERLASIKLPMMDRVGPYTLANCRSLKSVTLPSMVTAIDSWAFYGCDSLESINIPGFVASIGEYAFAGCPRLDSIMAYTKDPVVLNTLMHCFDDQIYSSCTVYVPQGSQTAYSSAVVWQNFNIVEFPCSLDVSESELRIGNSTGSIAKLSISSSTAWKVTSDQPWLVVKDSLGMLNDSVILVASANPGYEQRSATVTVSGNGTDPIIVNVTQEAGILVITRLFEIQSVELYYNPVSTTIVIKNGARNMAEIYDIRGTKILERPITSDYENLDVTKLSGGIYIIHVNGGVLKFAR